MRKAAILLLVLLTLCSVGAVRRIRELASADDEVVFTENVLYGDPGAAEGLRITRNSVYRNALLWQSDILLKGDSFVSETGLAFARAGINKVYGQSEQEYDGVTLMGSMAAGFGSSGLDSRAIPGLERAMQELVETTAPGSTGQKTVRVADYTEYYPIRVNVRLPELIYGFFPDEYERERDSTPETRAIAALQDFFRIPVLENEYYSLGVELNYDGRVGGTFGGSSEKGDRFNLYVKSAVSDSACYLWFQNRTDGGALVDTQQIPGGYGIYLLPYGMRKASPGEKTAGAEEYPDVFTEQLHLFYAVDPRTRIVTVEISGDQRTLFLHTVEEGQYVLTLLDAEAGAERQRFELVPCDPDTDAFEVTMEEDFCVVSIERRYFVFHQKENGEWARAFDTEPKEIELAEDYQPFCTWTWLGRRMAFDGERLAVCGNPNEPLFEEDGVLQPGCGFYAAVYDADGLAYYALFDSSLSQTKPPHTTFSADVIAPWHEHYGSVSWSESWTEGGIQMESIFLLLFGLWLPFLCLAVSLTLLGLGLFAVQNRTERKKLLAWAGVFAVLAFLPAIVLSLAAFLGFGPAPG